VSAAGGGDGSQPERLIARDSVNSAVSPDYPLSVPIDRRELSTSIHRYGPCRVAPVREV